MLAFRRILIYGLILFLSGADSKDSSKPVPSFPRFEEFFKRKSSMKKKYKLGKCEVDVRPDGCGYKTMPKKGHCLVFRGLLDTLIPEYEVVLNNTELQNFQSVPVTEFSIENCTKKVSFRTAAEGQFQLVPSILHLLSVEADISIPLPLNDFDIFGDGTWLMSDYQMKVKFNKIGPGQYNVKGAAEVDYTPVQQISSTFDLDILPRGPVGALLQNLDLENMMLRNCKVYGTVQPYAGTYQLVFSGSPNKRQFSGGNIRILVTNSGEDRNLALLLELQDYSPVTLLKQIYGPTIQRVNVLRDRNQTIALYVSPKPSENFSTIVSSHGTSRWIHMDSKFDAGATLLVTLPFPKRKALDMKVQLFSDGLGFSLPENEKLYGDLALGAISPSKIIRIDRTDRQSFNFLTDETYSKIRILKFRYFIFNDTYLAAAENLASVEDELAELMPSGAIEEKTESLVGTLTAQQKNKLDAFFKRESKENSKRNVDHATASSSTSVIQQSVNSNEDALSLAEKIGLLRK